MLEKRYYKVVAKCGHVGRNNYIPIAFAVSAIDGKEAAKLVRNFPRVKHNHKDAILSCIEIPYIDYLELKKINLNDDYLKCKNIQQQRKIKNFNDRIIKEELFLNDLKESRNIVKAKYIYKIKVLKEIKKFEDKEYGYLY